MLEQKLIELKDFILKYNTYLNNGFSGVAQDSETGMITNDVKTIFPSDAYGNYFYLRTPDTIRADYSKPIADNAMSIGLVADMILVAYIKKGSADVLAGNIATTIGKFLGFTTKINKIILQKDVVIHQELSKIDKKNQAAALQKIRSGSLISIQFTITSDFVFQSLTCLQDPCTC